MAGEIAIRTDNNVPSLIIDDGTGQPVRVKGTLSGDLGTILSDIGGRQNVTGIFGEQRATDIVNNILMQFGYGISPKDLNVSEQVQLNGGTISITGGNLLTASAGTNVAGETSIESNNEVRYRPGHTTIIQFTTIFSNFGNIDSEVWAGGYDDQNGFRIGFDGGVMKFQVLKNGTIAHTVNSSEFNGDIVFADYNFSMMNNWRIIYGYLGIAPISLEIMKPGTSEYTTVHVFRLQNTQAETHIDIPYLPFRIDAKNTGNNTDITVKVGSVQGGVFGLCQTCGTRFFSFEGNTTGNVLLAAGSTFVNFKSVDIFQTKHNHIVAELIRLNTASNTSDTVRIRFIKNPVLTGTADWMDVDATSSTVQYDNGLSYVSGGEIVYTDYMVGGKSVGVSAGSQSISLGDEGLSIQSGDIMTLQVDKIFGGTGNFDMHMSFNWQELF